MADEWCSKRRMGEILEKPSNRTVAPSSNHRLCSVMMERSRIIPQQTVGPPLLHGVCVCVCVLSALLILYLKTLS